MRGDRKETPNERLRDHHKNLLTSETPARQPGVTCSLDPNAPLWKALITFTSAEPMTEYLRAESAAAAKKYVEARYLNLSSVQIKGRQAEP